MTSVWEPSTSFACGTWLLKVPHATFACVLVKQPVMLVRHKQSLLEDSSMMNTSVEADPLSDSSLLLWPAIGSQI